ncbi:proline-rich protein HaeIII subfamily 1-like [Elephas maximus indicus]|uniref:proline-rich protein HaeIII subfamily 1-like n=1 Tax=Elephas maximus indicus TaxID=99487 RepID=UPI00211640E5|nr:proline-rich protein HaeIII subfamily 1-like [Elephas maximus indicus]
MRVPGWEGSGCQPPVSRDAASQQPELGPTRPAPGLAPPPLAQAAGASRSSPSDPSRVRPRRGRSSLGLDGKSRPRLLRGPWTALRRTAAAKRAAPARCTCLGPGRPQRARRRRPDPHSLQPPSRPGARGLLPQSPASSSGRRFRPPQAPPTPTPPRRRPRPLFRPSRPPAARPRYREYGGGVGESRPPPTGAVTSVVRRDASSGSDREPESTGSVAPGFPEVTRPQTSGAG